MKFIETDGSKKSSGHYSPAVVHNGILYISGQLSIDQSTGNVPQGGIIPETKQALENLYNILKVAGVDKNDVIQCRIYTPNVEYWDTINAVYAEFFGSHTPARSTFQVAKLPKDAIVEIEAILAR